MRASLVQGLSFGDEGKGTTVEHLAQAHEAVAVVRFNGGPQAAHHVVTAQGRAHCFAQLGAASLQAGRETFLSRFCLVEPLAAMREAQALAQHEGGAGALGRVWVDPRCVVVTPFHKHLNRLQELARGEGRHGSCGMGVGQAQLDSEKPLLPSVRAGDLLDREALRRRLRHLQLVKVDQAEQLVARAEPAPGMREELAALKERGLVEALLDGYGQFWASGARLAGEDHLARLAARGALVFEGAQGALLDRDHGFWPHVTPTRTTFHNALALLEEAGLGGLPRERVGVFRAYGSRHGAGPFVTEDEALLARLPEPHNARGPWQGAFRVGWFDLVAARYALAACGGADALSITCLDRLDGFEEVALCEAYACEAAPEELEGLARWHRPDPSSPLLHISALLPQPPADYARLGRLTALLGRCRPVYRALPGWARAREGEGGLSAESRGFLGALEEALGVRVGLASTGPRAGDKVALA